MTTLEPQSRIEYFVKDAIEAVSGDTELALPPKERLEYFLTDLISAIASIPEPTQEQITAAVNAYFAEHGVAFNTSAEIQEVLEG